MLGQAEDHIRHGLFVGTPIEPPGSQQPGGGNALKVELDPVAVWIVVRRGVSPKVVAIAAASSARNGSSFLPRLRLT